MVGGCIERHSATYKLHLFKDPNGASVYVEPKAEHARRIAMIERSQRQPQTSPICDAGYDKALPADSEHREAQNIDPFLYANCCLGPTPMDPLDFQAFAKGQLIAMAIFVPAAVALFLFFAS
jgi:hypothetical protein